VTCHANTEAVLNGIMEVAEFPQREIAFMTRTAVTLSTAYTMTTELLNAQKTFERHSSY